MFLYLWDAPGTTHLPVCFFSILAILYSAFFKFLIKDEMDVSFLECRGCCGGVSNFELSPITNDFSSVTSEINWNCVTGSVVGRGISYSLGNNDH